MLPLVRAAQRAGHEVRIATGPDLVGPLATRGLDVHAVGPAFAESWSAHEAVWADPGLPEEQKTMAGVVALFGTPALARLADLIVMAQRWRPELVVHEVLEVAGSLLGRRLEVPGVVHGIGPMFPFYAQLIGPAGAAMGEPGLWAQVSAEPAVDLCPPSLQPDGPRPWPAAIPLQPSAGEPGPVPPQVADVLAGDRPVAYFTLGTVKNTDTADLTAGLTALEGYDGVVVATTGRRLDPDDLGPVPANAVVAEVTGDPAFRAHTRRDRRDAGRRRGVGRPQRLTHAAASRRTAGSSWSRRQEGNQHRARWAVFDAPAHGHHRRQLRQALLHHPDRRPSRQRRVQRPLQAQRPHRPAPRTRSHLSAADHVDSRLLDTCLIVPRDARCVTAMRHHRHIQRRVLSD